MKTKNLFEKLLLLITASGIVVFWCVFFADIKHANISVFVLKEPCWLKWELSFPVADLSVAVFSFVALMLHLKNDLRAYIYQAIASGGMLFLGIIDMTFFVENKLYIGFDGFIEAIIHLWLLIAGLYLAIRSISSNRRKSHENSNRI
jgi:hypothetical protein